jgi:cytochrome c
MRFISVLIVAVLAMGNGAVEAQTALPGHGGPIRAVAADGTHIVSASFDSTALVWPEGIMLRGHAGAVNAVALMEDGAVVTGGADGRVLLNRFGHDTVELGRHDGPVAALATRGDQVASASWDGTIRVWDRFGLVRVLGGHAGNVNGVAFTPDGRVVSAGYDGTIRRWATDGTADITRLGVPQNAVAVAPDGQIAAAGADGVLRLIGATVSEIPIDSAALTALALSHDGTTVAVVSLGGVAMLVQRATGRIATVFNGADRPLWGVAFAGPEVITGGQGRVLRRWDPASGRLLGVLGAAPAPEPAGEGRGAVVFRACSACHSLRADEGNRAGPSLHGLFGRRIGGVPGFDYSAALRGMDAVWTPEAVARLFTQGPHAFAPGTKMPEQRVEAADLAALIGYLQTATE